MKRLVVVSVLLCSPLLAQAPTVTNYGEGCNGNILSISEPKIGTTVDATIINNDAKEGLVGIGVAKPGALIRVGGNHPANPCYLHVTPLWFIPFTSPGGGNAGATLFKIPNQIQFVGMTFCVQAVSLDSNETGWTQGIEAVIGK